jgi:alanine dehydrogenase
VKSLVYLSRAEVSELMPSIDDQIDLVAAAYEAHATGQVELPPKPGLHPRPNAFIHAMPAYLPGLDVAAIKWVSGYPSNQAIGLPYITGLIIVNDPDTGLPTAVMDAGLITAARTAAVSGYCIRHWAPPDWSRVALLGCGEQGRYHVEVIDALRPTATIAAYDLDETRYETLGREVEPVTRPEEAVEGADIVITAGPIVDDPKPVIRLEHVKDDSLVLPLDFDCYVARDVVEASDLFLVDDREQFEYYRSAGRFEDWPAPMHTDGEAELAGATGRRVVSVNLGVGSVDAVFAAHVLERAMRAGAGVELTR